MPVRGPRRRPIPKWNVEPRVIRSALDHERCSLGVKRERVDSLIITDVHHLLPDEIRRRLVELAPDSRPPRGYIARTGIHHGASFIVDSDNKYDHFTGRLIAKTGKLARLRLDRPLCFKLDEIVLWLDSALQRRDGAHHFPLKLRSSHELDNTEALDPGLVFCRALPLREHRQ